MLLIIRSLTTEHLDVLFGRSQTFPSTAYELSVKAAKISFFLTMSLLSPRRKEEVSCGKM